MNPAPLILSRRGSGSGARRALVGAILAALGSFPGPGLAADPARPEAGLTLRLLALRTRYVLDDGGVALRKQLDDAEQARAAEAADVARETTTRARLKHALAVAGARHAVEPQAVELAVDLVNDSKQTIELWGDGDDRGELKLALSGPGAVVVPTRNFQTMEVRLGVPFRLQPGEAHRIPISRLAYGHRGDAERAYFTRPGRYTLVATLVTGRRTGPAGPMGDDDAYARVVLTSKPITLEIGSPADSSRAPKQPRAAGAKDRRRR